MIFFLLKETYFIVLNSSSINYLLHIAQQILVHSDEGIRIERDSGGP